MTNEMDDLNRLFKATSGDHDEAKCEWCRDMLAAFVEAGLAGEDTAQRFPDVKEHLDTCADCEQEYAALLDLALADEHNLLPEAAGLLEPDLTFLRSASLPAFVRELVTSLAQSFNPEVLAELRSLLDSFLERAAALGSQPVPAIPPVLGEGPSALRVLAATYGATQAVVAQLPLADLEMQIAQQTLRPTLYHLAEQEALRQGFEAPQAQRFADQYAEFVGGDTGALRALVIKRQSK